MHDFKPLYRYSFEEARRLGEQEQWRESFRENQLCRNFIDELVRQNYDGSRLKGDIHQKTVAEFGFDRTRWVLANHIQLHESDGRYSPQNKAWAEEIYIPRPEPWERKEDPYLHDHNTSFLLNSHACLVDHIASNVQKMYLDLNLFDHRHCVPGSDREDYLGKVLVLRDTVLNEAHRTPDNQLFYADVGGFGCDPNASGRAVIGQFLIDGERMRFDRGDFVGVLDEQYMPEWAREKLAELRPADAPEEAQGPTMRGM